MKSIGLAIFSIVVLFGCGVGGGARRETTVLKPVQATQAPFKFVNIIESEHTAAVDADAKEHFRTTLNNMLYGTDDEPGPFKKGDGLTIKYRFIEEEKGSQFTRLLLGGLYEAGEVIFLVEVVYLDRTGAEFGRIRAEGIIPSEVRPLGVPFLWATELAAQEIAEYTEDHFAND